LEEFEHPAAALVIRTDQRPTSSCAGSSAAPSTTSPRRARSISSELARPARAVRAPG